MAQQAGIDSGQGQFLKGTNSYTGKTGVAEMGAHMIAGDTDVLIVVDVQNDFVPEVAFRCRAAAMWCPS